MCGIFGFYIKNSTSLSAQKQKEIIHYLFKLSESRGKEAAGLAVYREDGIHVLKEAKSATDFQKTPEYKQFIEKAILNREVVSNSQPIVVIGHSRLVTNGTMEIHDNNQPVIRAGLVGIHNGIIVNDEMLWQAFPSLHRKYEVDTEVILSLIRKFYLENHCLQSAFQQTFSLIQGTASIAILFDDMDVLALATNNGSLYIISTPEADIQIFASEKYILKRLLDQTFLKKILDPSGIKQLRPGCGYLIDFSDGKSHSFSLEQGEIPDRFGYAAHPSIPVKDLSSGKSSGSSSEFRVLPAQIFKRFEIDTRPIQSLRRCTRCILPETMPFIEFDEEGVCNYCRNHKPLRVFGPEALLENVNRYRKKDGSPDCLITFSGGRDSSYGVHYIKNVLNLNPMAYTYDWGMVTDLARRNQARLCGKLGIEHVLVSADIRKKRNYIQKNVTAWLKRPVLGTVPLFMAGDKQYFYYANKLKQKLNVELVFICINPFERTNFKTGFCGVKQPFNSTSNYALSIFNQVKLAAYYGKQYTLNPSYLNSSIPDTLGAFFSYYMTPHQYLNLYQYIYWKEDEINTTLAQNYDWEIARDTRSTWRIGDGTASFYNYIYFVGSGFTENDTFRSNQIREGIISREKALELVEEENQPRFDSIQWYCNTIGIDVEHTLERIVQMPKLYQQ